MSKPLKSKMIWGYCVHNTLLENNWITYHHGYPADCQLALTNVPEVQTKVVAMDKKIVGRQRVDTRSVV